MQPQFQKKKFRYSFIKQNEIIFLILFDIQFEWEQYKENIFNLV